MSPDLARLQRSVATLEDAEMERDAAVAEALTQGLTIADVADAAGLSVVEVGDIAGVWGCRAA